MAVAGELKFGPDCSKNGKKTLAAVSERACGF